MEAETEGEVNFAADAPSVLPIDRKTVHQICSGQVVLNLATAIKELLENSLDAGATSVEIRLKENGAELVEVSDNGCGVEPQNFEALTLKHHTSKIRDFSDLSSVETFGFRGEALSSLCALSNLTITTKHKSQLAGTRLVYDHNGKIQSQTACARQQGTTVTLCNLFSTLPVRHKEFLHNVKKELVKLVQVLQGYCIISNGVRIVCINQLEKGKKTTIVSTLGSDHIKDNISCIFGPKQVQSLTQFNQIKPSDEECNEYNINTTSNHASLFQVTGYISKADHGMGRSSADRQFYFINKRPCDLLKVSRVVNEVYHMYNRHQYPFVMLDISIQRDTVDVNVTPDKRKVFMQEEKMLLATIKSSLKSMFDPGTSNYAINQKPLSQLSFTVRTNNDEEAQEKLFKTEEKVNKKTEDAPRKGFPSLSSFKRTFSEMSGKANCKKEPKAKQAKLTTFCNSVRDFGTKLFGRSKTTSPENCSSDYSVQQGASCEHEVFVVSENDEVNQVECTTLLSAQRKGLGGNNLFVESLRNEQENEEQEKDEVEEKKGGEGEVETNDLQNNGVQVFNNIIDDEGEKLVIAKPEEVVGETKIDCPSDEVEVIYCQSPNKIEQQNKTVIKTKKDFLADLEQRKVAQVEFNMKQLQEAVKINKRCGQQESKWRNFRAKIAPDSNAAAEEELTKNISKDSFSEMEILGQFNLGFILTKLQEDIFIIDQHASDEKYNFETQQKSTTLQTQRLIIPKQLELTAVNECILIDNIEIFRKNGFEFKVDEDAQTTRKVQLVSVPVSRNWTFGVEDVEELIFMLSDSPGVMCRPSRVRKMFASRACRMSTMVGTALSRDEMRKIVNHMGHMEHPWNCPHGRPTMRHVINLNMIATGNEER